MSLDKGIYVDLTCYDPSETGHLFCRVGCHWTKVFTSTLLAMTQVKQVTCSVVLDVTGQGIYVDLTCYDPSETGHLFCRVGCHWTKVFTSTLLAMTQVKQVTCSVVLEITAK